MGIDIEEPDHVTLADVIVASRDLVELLATHDASEHEAVVGHALHVGAAVLRRAQANRDLDMIERKLDRTVAEVDAKLGKLPKQLEEKIIEQIGAENSDVLAPFKEQVEGVANVLAQRTKEVKDLLAKDLDPAKDSTTLGRALKKINDKLDPKHTESIQSVVEKTLEDVSKKDGRIAEAVKTVVAEALKPLQDQVADLAKEVRKNEAVEELLDETTKKGSVFEEAVVIDLQAWSEVSGASVEAVGADNQPGDVVVDVPSSALPPYVRVVVEARDRETAFGKKRVSDTVTKAMNERVAHGAVFVSKTAEGFAAEIGDWATGSVNGKPWVATTLDKLPLAIRYVAAQVELEALKNARPDVDVGAIASIATQITTALKDLANVKRVSSESAKEIDTYVESVRERVTACVRDLEREIARAHKTVTPIVTVK